MKTKNAAIVEILEAELRKVEALRRSSFATNVWIVVLESDDSMVLQHVEGMREPRILKNRNVLETENVVTVDSKRVAEACARHIGRNARARHFRDVLINEEQRIKSAIRQATFN